MQWIKKGLLIDPTKYDFPWMTTHAQNPFVENLGGNKYALYFSGRDKNGYAYGGIAELFIEDGHIDLINVEQEPILKPGPLGAFDDCGAMPSCKINNKIYYTGWSQKVRTPFTFHIGLQVNGKKYRGPVVGLSIDEPFMCASPWILQTETYLYKMWYVSCDRWWLDNNVVRHKYNIKVRQSRDGVRWSLPLVAIDYKDKEEYAIARPVVWIEDKKYRMVFCYRGSSSTYRAGYAESLDGQNWKRCDLELPLGQQGEWDSEMVCYPFMFKHQENWYLIYNGNSYGKTGCGYAVLEK